MKKILNGLFLACAFLAVALAFGYVAVEAAAVVIGNGALTVWAETYLEAPVCIMCSLHCHHSLFNELRLPLDLRRLTPTQNAGGWIWSNSGIPSRHPG